jgi:hypothetical protein
MPEKAPDQQTAPIAFTAEEANVMMNMLEPLAKKFKEENNHDFAALVINLHMKILHATMTGEGIPETTRRSMMDALNTAMTEGDATRFEEVFERLLVLTARLEPDPGKALALILLQYLKNTQAGVQTSVTAQAHVAMLELISKKLEKTLRDYAEDPSIVEIVTYLLGWAKSGEADVKAGRQLWRTDTDLFPSGVH